jgi:hypothetical protein
VCTFKQKIWIAETNTPNRGSPFKRSKSLETPNRAVIALDRERVVHKRGLSSAKSCVAEAHFSRHRTKSCVAEALLIRHRILSES